MIYDGGLGLLFNSTHDDFDVVLGGYVRDEREMGYSLIGGHLPSDMEMSFSDGEMGDLLQCGGRGSI
jgi:hypothetical protein